MKSSESENNQKGQKRRELRLSLALLGLAGVLVFSGCTTTAFKKEVPFGIKSVVDPFTVSTEKTGEGSFLLTLTSSLPEELSVDVRMRRTDIGMNYTSNNTKSDPILKSEFVVDNPKRDISSGEEHKFSVHLENVHEVSRPFYTIAYLHITSDEIKWVISVRIDDSKMFSDVEFLRQLNKTDYWHPKMIDENWNRYLAHIGE